MAMQFKVGSLVISTYGKDKGQLYFVLNMVDNKAFLVNGYNRTIKKPKTKNLKHINLIKNYDLDFNLLNDCDIIYKIRCLSKSLKNKCGGLN